MTRFTRTVWALVATAVALCDRPLAADEDASGAATAPSVATLYARHCAGCHGPDGRGDGADVDWLATTPRDLTSGFLGKYSDSELVDRLLRGERLRIELDDAAVRRRSDDTEAVVAFLRRIPRIAWEDVERGWSTWIQRCESCHGPYGSPASAPGQASVAVRDLSSRAFQESISDSELLGAVRHGRTGMPALVPRIGRDEAVDLVTFVRTLAPGFTIYMQTCAQCHGDHGRGVGSGSEDPPLPRFTFDASYFAETDREDLRNRVWHMLDEHRPRMPHFRRALSAAEATRIVELLRARSMPPRSKEP